MGLGGGGGDVQMGTDPPHITPTISSKNIKETYAHVYMFNEQCKSSRILISPVSGMACV